MREIVTFHKGDKAVGTKTGRVYTIVSKRLFDHVYYSFGDDYIPYYIVEFEGKEKVVRESQLKQI